MNKIYLSGNYVIVEKDGNVYEYPRTLSVYTIQGTNYVIKERIDDGQFVLPIADIGTYFDEAGAVAYTEATLVTFLRENTGFKTAGGGSPAFLLDLYNSEGGYSIRKISSTATNCIRVRRSSDNAEQDIGFSGNDLDTTSLLSFVGANDGFVTTWYDQSGNSRDAINASAFDQPRIVNAGVLETKNSKPAIYFNNDWVKYSGQVIPSATNPFSYFTVSSHERANSPSVVWKSWDAVQTLDGTYASNFHDRRTNKLNFLVKTSASYRADMSAQRDNSDYLLLSGFADSSNNISSFDNGATGGTSTYVSTYITDAFMIGNPASTPSVGLLFNIVGHIGEIIILNTDESKNRTSIETDINNYFTIF